MPLTTGTRLGPYEVLAPLGAGGMGEVYRARDTQLKRDVALKVLPAAVATDPERLARFQREAELLASLNHRHIAQIYGVAEADGVRALVMELVDGPTLAERIAQGAIPIAEALPIARQLAEALDEAHERGIVHRDLKPANIKVTPDGVVKVLDFGLAKALGAPGTDDPRSASDRANSPTMTSPAMTQAGVILGTAAYMSPEQARGKVVDKRADIWAFGVVLYEMLTGAAAFPGETITDVLGAIVKTEPDWTLLPKDVPARVRGLMEHCLQKDPRRRLRDIADGLIHLDSRSSAGDSPLAARPLPVLRLLPWAALAAMAALVIWTLGWRAPVSGDTVTRMTVHVPGGLAQLSGECDQFAVSPDGSALVFSSDGKLWWRRLDDWEAQPVPTQDARHSAPFFTPGGRGLAYAAAGALRRLSLEDGSVSTVEGLQLTYECTDAWWDADGTIAFRPGASRELAILRRGESTASPLTTTPPDRPVEFHTTPQLVDGGRSVLYTRLGVSGLWSDARVILEDMQTHAQTVVADRAAYARYVPPGFVLYSDGNGAVMALPFDLRQRRATGEPFAVAKGVRASTWAGGSGSYAVSLDGSTAAFALGTNARRTLFRWVDRRGQRPQIVGAPLAPGTPLALSPDDREAATVIVQQNNADVWIFDTQSGERRRLTTAPGYDWTPVWSPDGTQLAYPVTTDKGIELMIQDKEGRGVPHSLYRTDSDISVTSWVDGWILWQEGRGNMDIRAVRADQPKDVRTVVGSSASERNPRLSPDGHWLAYDSNEGGRLQVYVVSFPEAGPAKQVSLEGGGDSARWSPKGDELFYRGPDNMLMVVPVRAGARFTHGQPQPLFKLENVESTWSWAPSRDGQRFLVGQQTSEALISELHVVRNFTAVLLGNGKR